MTQITYYPQRFTVEAKGHANYADIGKDIVCASVSMLMYTLGMYADKLRKEDKLCSPPTIELKEGDANISIEIKPEYESEARVAFDAICMGFALLGETYPRNIQYNSISSI